MKIALIDTFYDVSHKVWAEGLKKYSAFDIDIFHLSPHNWKWRMTGGSLRMARILNESTEKYDLLLLTDMVNVPLLKSLLKKDFSDLPIILYFHENQITYPVNTDTGVKSLKRDHHYGFINYCSAIVADDLIFNSFFHKETFLTSLPNFLKMFPKADSGIRIQNLSAKSNVLPIGLSPPKWSKPKPEKPTFIWNHRWEYDKNPEPFFMALKHLKETGSDFDLIVTGKSYNRMPDIFHKVPVLFNKELIHFGHASQTEYTDLLQLSNIALITSYQDFFCISFVECLINGCYPLIPDRLVYKEHIPQDLIDMVTYHTDEDLYQKLKNIIVGRKYRQTEVFSDYVKKYFWNNVIPKYDSLFDQKINP